MSLARSVAHAIVTLVVKAPLAVRIDRTVGRRAAIDVLPASAAVVTRASRRHALAAAACVTLPSVGAFPPVVLSIDVALGAKRSLLPEATLALVASSVGGAIGVASLSVAITTIVAIDVVAFVAASVVAPPTLALLSPLPILV